MISDVAFDTFPWRLGVTFTIIRDNSSMVGKRLCINVLEQNNHLDNYFHALQNLESIYN